MKRVIIAVVCLFSCLVIAAPVIAENHHRNYGGHHGYRERPYGQRHYDHYRYNGHSYIYHGHWRSWNDWDRYARARPDIYRDGRYYHDGEHLMFRFCGPGTGNCFFFSIGR